jgi:hypothetical protein
MSSYIKQLEEYAAKLEEYIKRNIEHEYIARHKNTTKKLESMLGPDIVGLIKDYLYDDSEPPVRPVPPALPMQEWPAYLTTANIAITDNINIPVFYNTTSNINFNTSNNIVFGTYTAQY